MHLAVHHAYPEMPGMVCPHPHWANAHLQTLNRTCFLWLFPFILGPVKDRGDGEPSCMLMCSALQGWTIYLAELMGPWLLVSPLSLHHLDPWCMRTSTSLFPLSKPAIKKSIPLAGSKLKESTWVKRDPFTLISLTLLIWSEHWYYWLMWDCLHFQCW